MASATNTSSTEKLLRTIKGGGTDKSGMGKARKASPVARASRKRSAPVIGVDIAPDSLRLVKISRADGTPRLEGYWSVPYDDEKGSKSKDFPKFLSARLAEFKGSDRKAEVWSLVSSAQAEMFHIRVPKVPRAQLSETVYWSAQKEKAFKDHEYLMDYEVQNEIMDKGVPKIQVLVYMVPHEVVSKRKEMFAAAGIKPTGITISPIALQSLFRSELVTENGESCANIYIGRNWSRIDIFAKGNLVLSRGVNTGTSSLVSALAEAYEDRIVCEAKAAEAAMAAEALEASAPPKAAPLEIEADLDIVLDLEEDDTAEESEPVLELDGGGSPFELEIETAADDTPEPLEAPEPADTAEPAESPDAESACRPPMSAAMTDEQAHDVLRAKLLGHPLEDGHPGSELSAKEVVELAGSAMSRLVRQIERTFDHHTNTQGGDAIQRIFFSGDLCTNAHFMDELSRLLELPCSLLDPLGVLGGASGAPSVPESSGERLAFNLVCGLALCDGQLTPNLLRPYNVKDKIYQEQRQGNIVYGIFLVAAAILAGFWFWQHGVANALQAELDKLDAKVESFSPKIDETLLLGMATKAGQMQIQIKKLSAKYEGLAAVNEIGRLTPETIRLRSMGLEFGEPAEAKPENEASRPGEQARILILDGRVGGPSAMFDAVLATYLAKLNNSPLFTAPVVHKREIERRKGKDDVLRFIIHLNVV